MKNSFRGFLILLAACSCSMVKAQDPHFSQYFNVPLFVNPANAGNGIEYMRATLIYRNQWASVASPFITEGFMVDKKVNRIGFGFLAVKNSAGKSSLKQLNLAGVMSYNQPIGENNQVTGALQLGMMHKSFDPSEMTFDSQFSEDIGFDPNVNSGEIFTATGITRPDAGMGFMWQRGFGNIKIKFKPFGGFAVSHINKPTETFIAGTNKLPVKSTFNFGSGIMVGENMELRPSVLYMIQDHSHEFNYGMVTSFLMQNNNKFQVGLYNRSNDALMMYAGYQVNQMFIGTSYDINMSGLKQVSRGNGGFEITISYIPKAKKNEKAKQPAKTQKAPVARKHVQKAEKKPAVRQVEQTVTIPDKLEVINKVSVTAEPVAEKKQAEAAPGISMAAKEETKPVVHENNVSPAPAETSPVPVKAANPPAKTEQPVIREAPVEFNIVKEKEKEVPVTPKQHFENTRVEPKMHTVYIDLNKPAVEDAAKPAASNKVMDTDGDGIPDSEDHCPYIKGGIKTNGCPDSDNDGIIDMMDECPLEPGPAKNYGCPEIKPAVDNAMLIKKFDNIEFETGKSVVKTADVYDIIEYAIDILYEHPESSVLLSGHTDSEGNDLFNMHLSEKRTLVVKKYMIKKGIDEGRIQTVNYGETMPLMNNSSEYSKARNRRVELNILKSH